MKSDRHPRSVLDPITHTEVIYAPLRAERANAFTSEAMNTPATERCPFCPGNEHETPPAVQEWFLPHEPKCWQVRAIPNRFPVVIPGTAAAGRHEVLIDSNQHDATWRTMPLPELTLAFQAVAQRIQHFEQDRTLQCLQVFKNVGKGAGASLAHPHLQLVGLEWVPAAIASYRERAQHYFQTHGRHYHADLLEQALKQGATVVQSDSDFVTLCPPVSRVPYEMWLVPRHAVAYVEQSPAALAQHLQQLLQKLQVVVGDVAHNIVWQLPWHANAADPWRLEILPRLTSFAGLEFGTGLYVNPILPAVAAERLRKAIA